MRGQIFDNLPMMIVNWPDRLLWHLSSKCNRLRAVKWLFWISMSSDESRWVSMSFGDAFRWVFRSNEFRWVLSEGEREGIPNFSAGLQFETQRKSTQKKFTASLLDLRSVTGADQWTQESQKTFFRSSLICRETYWRWDSVWLPLAPWWTWKRVLCTVWTVSKAGNSSRAS